MNIWLRLSLSSIMMGTAMVLTVCASVTVALLLCGAIRRYFPRTRRFVQRGDFDPAAVLPTICLSALAAAYVHFAMPFLHSWQYKFPSVVLGIGWLALIILPGALATIWMLVLMSRSATFGKVMANSVGASSGWPRG
jgi:hypothetical protein